MSKKMSTFGAKMKIRYRFVFNRKRALNAMGEALVQIEAYQNRRKAYFSTNIYVKPSEWVCGIVVNRHDAEALNGMLTEQLMKLQAIEVAMWRCGTTPTLQHLREGWRRKETAATVLAFTQEVIGTSDRAESTKANLLSTARTLHRFRPAQLNELDFPLLCDFLRHLRERGNCLNTIAKHIHHLRTIVGETVRRGLIPNGYVPFERLQIRTERREHVALSEDELRCIAQVDVFPQVRDAFLFCCRTGLRYSDYVRLANEHFRLIGEETWIEMQMKKTHQMVRVPLTALTPLVGEAGNHPAIPRNPLTNQQLKQIVEKAHITKRVTFHTARHTFATLLLAKGVPITTVQALLGHSSVRTTQRYAEVKQSTILNDLHRAAR